MVFKSVAQMFIEPSTVLLFIPYKPVNTFVAYHGDAIPTSTSNDLFGGRLLFFGQFPDCFLRDSFRKFSLFSETFFPFFSIFLRQTDRIACL
jgi:hypothetical protein